MRLSFILVVVILVAQPISAQSATIWGIGDNYEIDFLHSGDYLLDGETEISFENEPVTEFRIQNVTNDDYDYTYVGYGGVQMSGTITMVSLNLGFGSITYPQGDMPVMVPLSYRDEDDWMTSFEEKIKAVAGIPQDIPIFKMNSSIDTNKLSLVFEITSNASFGFEGTLFNLPNLIPPRFEGKNNTFLGTIMTGEIEYSTATGLLFLLNLRLASEELLVDSISQGSVEFGQRLDFVAVIPPVTLPNNVSFPTLTWLGVISIIIIKKLKT